MAADFRHGGMMEGGMEALRRHSRRVTLPFDRKYNCKMVALLVLVLLAIAAPLASGGPPAPVPLRDGKGPPAPSPLITEAVAAVKRANADADSAGSPMAVPHIGHMRAGQPRYALDVEKCTWAMPKSTPFWRFRDGTSRPSLRDLVAEGVSPDTLERVHVDIPASEGGAPQTCGVTTYAMGVMQRFSYALLSGDVVTDCAGGSVLPDGVAQRPDQDPDLYRKNAGKNRGGLRKPVSQAHYRAAATGGEKSVKMYRRGFVMNYHRDTNYQMFVVSSLTRWWYMLKLLEAGWPTQQDAADGTGTITVVLSGTSGGSLQQYEGKPRAAPYIPEMLQLLTKRWNDEVAAAGAGTLRPRLELVAQDGPLFFEELWVPGWAGHNYHFCFLKDVSPPISGVMQLLKENALAVAMAASDPAAGASSLSAELRAMVPSADRAAEINRLKSTCVSAFITRVDVKKQKLDGAARELKDAGQLIKDLGGSHGFCIVNAAEYTTVEKAVLLSETKVLVVELGAGLTNLLYVADGCTVIQISNPILEDKKRFVSPEHQAAGYTVVQGSWPRDTMAPQMFGHLHLKWGDLSHHTVATKGGAVNSPFRFKDYAASLAKIVQLQQTALQG
jgi:hypothetical protein